MRVIKLLMILFAGIILISYSYALSCYQESTNTTNQVGTDGSCGLNYSGNYGLAANYIYMNYSKPLSASSAIWRIKFGYNGSSSHGLNENISLSSSCYNNSNIISLRVYSIANDVGSCKIESYGECYYSGLWHLITTNSSSTICSFLSSVVSPSYIYDGNWNSFASYYSRDSIWTGLSEDYSYDPSAYSTIYEEAMIWNVSIFNISNIIYNSVTTETSTENYNITFVGYNLISASAILYYNGTTYPSTTNCISSLCTSSNAINLPSQSIGQVNNSFYWTITTYNGTDSITYNSSVYNQTVNQITLTQCTSGTIALNFTLYDEQNKTRLSPFNFDANFQYSTSIGETKKILNITNSTLGEIDLCINKNITYYVDAIIAYYNGTYPVRNWFYQSYPISNATQKVNLYSLNSASSTSFILQVFDEHRQPVPQVLVNAQRCYPGSNTNETVFISRTDSNGMTTGNLEAETALYRFLITNQSQTLLSITPCAKVIPQTTPYTITFNLGGTYQSPVTNINNLSDIASSIVFNNSNGILTWTYTDTSGKFNSSEMVVSGLNMSGNNNIVCDTSGNLSSQILTCNITSAGTYSVRVYVYRDNQILIDQTIITYEDRSSTAGYYGVFLAFFLIIISAFAFKFNEIAGIILVNVMIIFVNVVGLVNFGVVAITAILGISAVIIGVLQR